MQLNHIFIGAKIILLALGGQPCVLGGCERTAVEAPVIPLLQTNRNFCLSLKSKDKRRTERALLEIVY